MRNRKLSKLEGATAEEILSAVMMIKVTIADCQFVADRNLNLGHNNQQKHLIELL